MSSERVEGDSTIVTLRTEIRGIENEELLVNVTGTWRDVNKQLSFIDLEI